MAVASSVTPVTLFDLPLSSGKKTRLYRMLYQHGPGNGRALFLPLDQGLEHGPRDFFDNPDSADTSYQMRLAIEGGYSGIVLQIGQAEKYYPEHAGQIPLVLKLNGKTEVPSDAQSFSPQNADVADAVRLGADAVGYTVYVGSPAQDRDFAAFAQVRRDAERLGMPVIVWAYPRGEAVNAKGGKSSLYMIDYAARVSAELGADVIKINVPDPTKREGVPSAYRDLDESVEEAVRRVIASAGRSLTLISGGEKVGDESLLATARMCAEAGATGFIFGRNLWQRPWDDALRMTAQLKEILS